MGRKAQIALFVLIGIILVIGLVIGYRLYSQRQATVTETAEEQAVLQNNPELAAEKARMIQRVEECVKTKAKLVLKDFVEGKYDFEGSSPPSSLTELEKFLAKEIGSEVPDCYFQFNMEGKLDVSESSEPDITLIISPSGIVVNAKLSIRGKLDTQSYTIPPITASVPTPIGAQYTNYLSLMNKFTDAVAGRGASSTNKFINIDGSLNLYGYQEQHIYADLAVNPDKTCTLYLSDYDGVYRGVTTGPTYFPPSTVACTFTEQPVVTKTAEQLSPTCDASGLCSFSVAALQGMPQDADVGCVGIDVQRDRATGEWRYDKEESDPGPHMCWAASVGTSDDNIEPFTIII